MLVLQTDPSALRAPPLRRGGYALFFLLFSCKIETYLRKISPRLGRVEMTTANQMESNQSPTIRPDDYRVNWQKIISFAYFTVLAHNIGVENTGKYFCVVFYHNLCRLC